MNETYEQILQTAAAATGNGTVASNADAGRNGAALIEVTGTFVGTVTFEGSRDGTTWYALTAVNRVTGALGSTATAPGLYLMNVLGLSFVRARVSAYTSGAITASVSILEGMDGPNAPIVP